jgi:hypothetical protein
MQEASQKSQPVPKTKPQPGDRRYGRSAVSNGTRLLPGIDGRNTWVRRCRDIIAEHVADKGGMANCSAPERSIIRRAATLTVELERMESVFAVAGEALPEQLDLYQRTANSLRRLLEAVGLERRAKTIVPTLSEYLEARMVVPIEDEDGRAD